VAAFTTTQIVAITTGDLAVMATDDLRAFTTAQFAALETAQIDALSTTQLSVLTTSEISALTADQLGTFGDADIQALTTTQFAALRTSQIELLSADQVIALGTADIVALTTAQAHALTPDQITAMTTAQIVAFETADLAAMTMAQYNAFEAEDWGVMSTAQFAALQSVTPMVLDLNGDGIHTLAASQGVSFDLTATGTKAQVGWVGSGDGLLVRDINHDGVINDGTELFGGATVLANGKRAGNGYAAMAALDSNHDGKLSALDDKFSELNVWVDANHDGKTDAGELKSLLEVGVLEINLDFTKGTTVDNGNLLGMVSSYTSTDGTQHAAADVWFSKQAAASVPSLGELLAGPAPDLLAGPAAPVPGAASAAAASAANATPALVNHDTVGSMNLAASKLSDDELLRQQQQIIL